MTYYPKGFYEFRVIDPRIGECVDAIRLPIAALPELIRDMQDVVGAMGDGEESTIRLSNKDLLKLECYLLNHEEEIAEKIGNLRGLFKAVFDREPNTQAMRDGEKKKPKFTGTSPIKDVANAMAEMTDELRELLDEMKKPKADEETEQPAIYVATRYNQGAEDIERVMVNNSQAEAEKQAEDWFCCIGGVWTCLDYNYWECEEKQTIIKITKVILNR